MLYKKNKSTRYYSDKQEKSIAKAVKGKQTPNSGATAFSKGDVITDSFLLEAKTQTSKKRTFTLHEEWFTKNQEEAFAMGKEHSAVVFNFGPNEPNYYVIDEKLFIKLKEIIENED